MPVLGILEYQSGASPLLSALLAPSLDLFEFLRTSKEGREYLLFRCTQDWGVVGHGKADYAPLATSPRTSQQGGDNAKRMGEQDVSDARIDVKELSRRAAVLPCSVPIA